MSCKNQNIRKKSPNAYPVFPVPCSGVPYSRQRLTFETQPKWDCYSTTHFGLFLAFVFELTELRQQDLTDTLLQEYYKKIPPILPKKFGRA